MEESQLKTEPSAERKPAGYKSWKKKYRKMRILFDQKMQIGEELHRQEAKTAATVKRIAIENDQILDILLEVNNSEQIPPDKRIDVALRARRDDATTAPRLAIDRNRDHDRASDDEKTGARKKLQDLLATVPHTKYAAAKKINSALVQDLVVADGEPYPASFLTADDIDDYIFAIDKERGVNNDTHPRLPTLAPRAHPASSQISSHPHLKNPTSVTNWLRKHAPKIFLQDGETHDTDGGGGGDGSGGGGGANTALTGGTSNGASGGGGGGSGTGAGAGAGTGTNSARKSRGARNDRGSKPARTKRASGASRASNANHHASASDKAADWDASVDEEQDIGTPVSRGKRKRNDDVGYRPGGSASRPSKKKRKSGDSDGTPSARSRVKKETAAAE